MEMILLIGIPASGKSSFYKEKFFAQYMRISLDLFNTRSKEQQFLALALDLQQRIVIDNTNVTKQERKRYMDWAIEKKYTVTGYYFKSDLDACLARNNSRSGKEKIPLAGVLSRYKDLELPRIQEGFNKLNYVELVGDEFKINDWQDEI